MKIRMAALLVLVVSGTSSAGEKPASTDKADPQATRLLADARAARALYQHFPGFKADLELNVEGRVYQSDVQVTSEGKISVHLQDEEANRWAKHTLGSIIFHRLDNGSGETETPCAFADEVQDHPLGRAIRVLNDEFHSSYRIRDRQVLVVNRNMSGTRFTITVLKNDETPEKKFLPTCFMVQTWDEKTDSLKSSETHYQTWKRIEGFDLPKTLLVIKGTSEGQQARRMILSSFRLTK